LREIERVIPDLVLLDYSLPDFNADELCALLLQNERTAHVPVLMMSGHVPEMTAAAARFPNIVATIEKPFLSDALMSLVHRTLKASAKKRAKAIESAPTAEPSDEEVRLRAYFISERRRESGLQGDARSDGWKRSGNFSPKPDLADDCRSCCGRFIPGRAL
jgi:DNA-binding NtrC family response regulator